MVVKTGVAGAYAKKAPYEYEGKSYEADIKNGDTVTILNAGSTVVGQFGEKQVFSIETRNGPKNFTMNQTTINVLAQEFGDESNDWVGKKVSVVTKKDVVANKKVEIAHLVAGDWGLDEWGDIVKKGSVPEVEYTGEDIEL